MESVEHQTGGGGNVNSEQFGFGAHRPVLALVQPGRAKEQRTDGGNVCGVEIVLGKSDDQTCFAHSAVSDEQQFKKKIVLFRHGLQCP